MQQDVHFALTCNLLVARFVEAHLFKDFVERVKRFLQGATKSSVSQLWSARFKSVFKQFGEIAEDVHLDLKSHQGKNGCDQKLAKNPLTAGLLQVFYSGWELWVAHTSFECVVPSESMARQTCEVLSNWCATVDGSTVGGEPPSVEDIRGEENSRLARMDCAYLFRCDCDSRWSPAIREKLFTSLLRFCPDLVKLLEQHPTGRHKDLKSHPVTRVLLQGLDDSDVYHCRFNDWCACQCQEGISAEEHQSSSFADACEQRT